MNKSDYIIRDMFPEDLDQVETGETASHSNPWSRNTFEMDVRLSAEGSSIRAMLVAEKKEDHKIVGHVCLLHIDGEATITNITVYPQYRRCGIGSLLLDSIMDRGKVMGAQDFTLEVRLSNEPALKMYEKAGFAKEGIRRNYYENPREDAAILWKRAAFHKPQQV